MKHCSLTLVHLGKGINMLAIIIITLATTTQANTQLLFPCEWLDYQSKIDLTKDVTANISTDMCNPANYPDSVITNLVKRNGSFDK